MVNVLLVQKGLKLMVPVFPMGDKGGRIISHELLGFPIGFKDLNKTCRDFGGF